MSTPLQLRDGQTKAFSDEDDHRSWDLVHAARAGDMGAYEALYTRYHHKVMRYLRNRLEDLDLCEDLAAETFARALRRIDSVTYQGRDVAAWFITIARNLMLDDRKSSRVRLERPMDDSPVLAFVDRDRQVDPDRVAMHTSLAELLEAALDQLGRDQREVLALRFQRGLSVAETSEALGRCDGATKALQHRACARMRRLLDESVRDYLT